MVLIFAPLCSIVVPLEMSTTLSQSASTMGDPGRSIRWNLIPWLGLAGTNVIFVFAPVCKPTPDRVTDFWIVCCLKFSIYFIKDRKFNPYKEIIQNKWFMLIISDLRRKFS